MNIRELLKKGTEDLKHKESGALEAQMLLSYVLNMERTRLFVYHDRLVTDEQEKRYNSLVDERKHNVPVQYLIGECEFMSLPFHVDSNVLIPRCDTEILVEQVIRQVGNTPAHIADLCCGSGCIGVSLAYYLPKAEIFLADISDGALHIAEKNSRRHHVAERTVFQRMDVLNESMERCFDVIVSNPPYIPPEDISALEPEVRDYEPRLALEASENGLQFYRILSEKYAKNLKTGGLMAFEVGIGQAEEVSWLMTPYFERIAVYQDLQGIDRVVTGKRK